MEQPGDAGQKRVGSVHEGHRLRRRGDGHGMGKAARLTGELRRHVGLDLSQNGEL